MSIADFWRLLAGLGMFLYGMLHLEEAMKQVDGRSFKLFLKKNTKNKLNAIFSGTIVTGILQSSSIVNLMVLSFVGAGMLSMRNALGVVLGVNVGGTLNSWLVAKAYKIPYKFYYRFLAYGELAQRALIHFVNLFYVP